MGQSLRPTWIVRGFSCSSLCQLYVPVQHRTQGQRRSFSENEPNFGSNCEHSAVRRGGYWNTVLIHCPPRQVKSPCNSWSLAVRCPVSSRQPRIGHSPRLQATLLRLSATFASTSGGRL